MLTISNQPDLVFFRDYSPELLLIFQSLNIANFFFAEGKT